MCRRWKARRGKEGGENSELLEEKRNKMESGGRRFVEARESKLSSIDFELATQRSVRFDICFNQ